MQFYFHSFSSLCSIWLIFLKLLISSINKGRPQPEVRWLINGLPVDDQYEHNSGDVIENRLLWPAIQRSDLNSIFTCQALNTDLVDPKETSFVLDMHCKFDKLQNNWLPWLQENIEHHSIAYKNKVKLCS